MADGSGRFFGIPEPDPDRLQDMQAEVQADPAVYGERSRQSVRDCLDLVLAEARTGDLTEAGARLDHLIACVESLHPRELEPRRGLAGLFDSRNSRLKRFRSAFQAAGRTVKDTLAEIEERLKGVETRGASLNGALDALREGVREIHGHVRVGLAAAGVAPVVKEGEDRPDDPHQALRTRIDDLDAHRASGVAALPYARAIQNADAWAADAIRRAAPALNAWQEDWTARLGLDRKRPRKVRPDISELQALRDRLLATLTRIKADLAQAQERRKAQVARLETLRNG
ncbi:toxic anion resistance protein [Brevundimonas sp.]|uniref:toxic anion resistance protein n=1 Tax=Brevundimonas sp. TaxID=1871086 RepID=UPI001DA52D63|nr:toxic anion resistance protein [Brevundimonas sp.]MBL0948618.1 toxic anion resistance protein [Brevundimonas sp.]